MNAFEIRLEILKMAKEMMDRQYQDSTNFYWGMVDNMVKMNQASVEKIMEQTKQFKPEMYDPMQIMEKAQELYKFVASGKKD